MNWGGRRRNSILAIGLIVMVGSCAPREKSFPPSGNSSGDRVGGSHAGGTADSRSHSAFFVEISEQRGLHASHQAADLESFFFPASMSPGAAWIDYDRDGDLDALVAAGGGIERQGSRIKLFQQDSQHHFRDVTAAVGLAVECQVQGFAVGDVDNDGYDDIFVTAYRGDLLLKNLRGERFEDITNEAGIGSHGWSTSAAFVDYDRDGRLDLFVCQYVDYDPTRPCFGANGRQDFCNPAMFERTSDRLYRNSGGDGKVKFEDQSQTSGIAQERGAGLGVVCGDFNGDQWPDIYVANDGHANFLWINQRDGTFRNEAIPLGAAYDLVGRGQGSMGVAAEDLNRDGILDLFVANLDGESNALYLSDSNNGFVESSAIAGLARPSFAFTGFGAAFLDIENDGDLDLAVMNGRVRRRTGAASQAATFWDDYSELSHLYLNQGSEKYELASGAVDPLLSQPAVLRGLAVGDFDDDGRVDLLASAAEGQVRLYRNATTGTAHWVSLKLVDPRWGGRTAAGAIVELHGGERVWRRQATTCGSYLSAHDGRVHFGLGEVEKIEDATVVWPDGVRERFRLPGLDRVVLLERGKGLSP